MFNYKLKELLKKKKVESQECSTHWPFFNLSFLPRFLYHILTSLPGGIAQSYSHLHGRWERWSQILSSFKQQLEEVSAGPKRTHCGRKIAHRLQQVSHVIYFTTTFHRACRSIGSGLIEPDMNSLWGCEGRLRAGRMHVCVSVCMVWNLKPCHLSSTIHVWQAVMTGNLRGQGQEFGIPSVRVYLRGRNLECNVRKELKGVERSSSGFTVCSSCCFKDTEYQN